MRFIIYLAVLFIIATTSIVVVGRSFAGVDDPNFTKVYETSKGVVTFDHKVHADVTKDCVACHEILKQFNNKVTKDFGHKGCNTCHVKVNEQGSKRTPVTCTDCHIK